MPPPVPVIINAAAGNGHGRDEPERLRTLFRDAGAEAEVFQAKHGENLQELARRLAHGKPPLIVAGGGDGTINAVASVLAGTDIALGVLPLGTLNHFARDLGIPLDPPAAARVVLAGRRAAVDVGEVNGRIFVNNSSIGLYPSIVRHREMQRRQLGRGKWHALFWASLTALRRAAFLRVQLRLDEEERRLRTPFIFIGNNPYTMEGFNVGTRERLDTGELSVYLTRRRSRWGLLGLALRALFGRLQQARDFEAHTARSLRIETRRARLAVATDGEIELMPTPLEYRIRSGALRVLVPQKA